MEKIRVGVIGTGMAWEKLHYPAFNELADYFEIGAVCDLRPHLVESWGRMLGLTSQDIYTDYQRLIQRPDLQVIDILVPIADNHRLAAEAAKAGKSIILEKPMGATYQEALATQELPLRYGIKLMIAENYRYSDEFNILRKLITEEKLGPPVFFVYHNTSCFPCAMKKNTYSAKEWRQHPAYPGGDILDAAIHNLAGIRHIFGGIRNLQAFGVPQNYDFSPYAALTVNMEFMSGVIGHFSYYPAGQEPQKPLIGLRIFCTEGQIYLESTDCGIINLFYSNGQHEEVSFRPMQGYYNELLNFYYHLHGREALGVPPEMELGDLRTVFAILQSTREVDIVKVDEERMYSKV